MNVSNRQSNPRCLDCFWELVRCGLSGETPPRELFLSLGEELWTEVFRMVRVQAVTGVCYPVVQALPAECRPPYPLLVAWHVQANYIISSNRRLRRVWFDLNGKLRAAGLQPVLLKGISLAAYYPNPLCRMIGDLDIYLPNGYDRATALIESWGVAVERGRWHHKFTYEGVEVELHHTYWGKDEAASDCFKEVEDEGNTYTVLDGWQGAQLQIVHAIHHLIEGGVGVRHLCDWAAYLLRGAEAPALKEWEGLFKQRRLEHFVYAFSGLAAMRLGTAEAVPRAWAERGEKNALLLEKDMLLSGNFGKGNPFWVSVDFRTASNWKKWKVVSHRMIRAWAFRGLCPLHVKGYIKSQLAYVYNYIASGRVFSGKGTKK